MARQETSPFILFIGKHPFIYYTLFINELNSGTLGNVPDKKVARPLFLC
jgi:hypothetical protein